MNLMRIIAVISIPFLMLSDYFFTIMGKKLRDNIYIQHVSSDQYELNPAWQKDIEKLKLFNYKHVLLVILVTGYFYFAAKLLNDTWFELIYGALFTVYICIIMRHTNNIMIYKFANKNPEKISGKVIMSYLFTLNVSMYQIFTTAVFMMLLAAWTGSWFLFGGGCGLFILTLIQKRWIRAYKKKINAKYKSQQFSGSESQLPS